MITSRRQKVATTSARVVLRASVPHGNYGTALLGSIGGAVGLAFLGNWYATTSQQHAATSDAVGFARMIGLTLGGIWLGSMLGSALLLGWRSAGGALVTAVRLALLIPITLVLVLGLPEIILKGLFSGSSGALAFVLFLIAWSVVLLLPTLLARAWAIEPRTRRFGPR